MTDRHLRDLDRAAALAHRFLAVRPDADAATVTRMLRRRWWCGSTQPVTDRSPGDPAVPLTPWRTWGEHWDPAVHPDLPLLQLFLGCAPGTALQTVATVSHHAGRWSQPWLLSSRALQQRVPRPDATSLVFPVDSLPSLRTRLGSLVSEVRPFLGSQTPMLTMTVGRGAALAQAAPRGTTYGEHRCRLVAGAVVAHRHASPAEMQRQVREAYVAAGLDPRAPYRTVGADWHWRQDRVAA